jgi:FlaA1/EpsC-like NDP-sugar epimerase
VLKAGGVGENAGLYLLDMGEPIYIQDLAKQMIRFYGFEPDRDIKIVYTGTRAGERLDERLWAEDEEPVPSEFNRILSVKQQTAEYQKQKALDLEELVERLYTIAHYIPAQHEKYRNSALLYEILQEVIPSMGTVENNAAYSKKIKAPVF